MRKLCGVADQLGHILDAMTSPLTFLPGVGFRQAGVRLAHETRIERDGRTLTVTQFVSTPEGSDLTYEITDPTQNATCVVPGRGPSPFDPDTVTLSDRDHDYGAAFVTSSGVIAGGVRRTLQAKPVPSAARALELRIASGMFGDWSVLLEFVPFGADAVGGRCARWTKAARPSWALREA